MAGGFSRDQREEIEDIVRRVPVLRGPQGEPGTRGPQGLAAIAYVASDADFGKAITSRILAAIAIQRFDSLETTEGGCQLLEIEPGSMFVWDQQGDHWRCVFSPVA